MSSALPAELSGRAFKPTPKAESLTRTAPFFYQLHRGAIAAPSQNAEDLKSERGLPTPGGPSQPHHWIRLKRKFKLKSRVVSSSLARVGYFPALSTIYLISSVLFKKEILAKSQIMFLIIKTF